MTNRFANPNRQRALRGLLLVATMSSAPLVLGAPLKGQVFEDSFNRPDAPVLGAPWEVIKGTSLKLQAGRAEAVQAVQSEDAVIVAGLNKQQQTIDVDWTPTLTTTCSGVDGHVLARVQDANNYYGARVAQGVFTDALRLYKVTSTSPYTELASLDVPRVTAYPFHLRLTVTDNTLEFRVSRPGTQDILVTALDSDLSSGSAGLLAFAFGGSCAPEARSSYDNLVISSTDEIPFVHPVEPWVVSGYTFGVDWEEEACFTEMECDAQAPRRYKHAGLDVAGNVGDNVVASRAGKAVFVARSLGPSLGGAVILEHDMDGIPTTTYDRVTTLYLHITPSVKKDTDVAQEDVLGTIANIPSAHLHFGFRRGPFCGADENAYLRGALPPAGTTGCEPCFGMPAPLPEFPENWEDPASLF